MRGAARQRGASAVFVAISMVASIAALGMSLDLGRLYFMHRDLQLLADMAALDASRAAGGCLGQTEDPQGSAAGEAASSLQRNGASLAYLTAGNVEIGRQIARGGVRAFVNDDSTRADSVKVTLRRPLPPRLVPVFSSGPGGVMAVSAAASLRPIVSIDVGSSLLDVAPGTNLPLIPGMLGNPDLQISGPSYSGLASVSVELGDLAAAANAGSVQDFLETETSAPGLLDAIAGALDNSSDTAVRTTLRALATGADTSRRVVPREVLGVPAGSTADDALVNVGALVTSIAQAANGANLISVPINLNLPPLLDGTVDVRLIELARPAVGPPIVDAGGQPQTFANTAQALAQLDVGTTLLGSEVRLKMYVQLADASAGVSDLRCSQRGRPFARVTIDTQSSIGGIGVGEFVDINARTPPTAPQAATIARLFGVEIKARADAPLDADRVSMVFDGPFPSQPQYIGTDPGEALARALDDMTQSLEVYPDSTQLQRLEPAARRTLELAVNALKPEIVEAIRGMNTAAVGPLLGQLGVDFGSARVAVRSVVAQQPEIYAR